MNKQIFQTSSIALAGAIITCDFKLLNIDKTNPERALFIFEKSERLEKMVNQYWAGEIKIEPIAYFNALKLLKTRLYGEC